MNPRHAAQLAKGTQRVIEVATGRIGTHVETLGVDANGAIEMIVIFDGTTQPMTLPHTSLEDVCEKCEALHFMNLCDACQAHALTFVADTKKEIG